MSSYTGITFGDYHSYDAWGLKLKEAKIGYPEAKTEYVDVPGMDGHLDLTEAQNGGVKYGMRELEFKFDARNCNYPDWLTLISTIGAAIEGRDIQITPDFDASFYYNGRCHISTEKTNEVKAVITIECNCQPYKIYVSTSDGPWLWDPFSFVDGVTTSTSDIAIDSTTGQEVEVAGYAHNEALTIVSNADMTLTYGGNTYEISTGTNVLYDLELAEGANYLYFTGTGTITIISQGGRI